MKNISILGCGWLGFPLAQKLLQSGFGVKGSTTSPEKIKLLEGIGILPFLISLDADGIHGEIDGFLSESDLLIIDIPPKLRGSEAQSFVSKIENLIPEIENSGVGKVIFISSTSVYADDNSVITEASKTNPDTESGRQLLQAESILKNNNNFKTTILRFGGLIGEDRHPVKFLSAKDDVENPEAPINLIHQDDCVGIILKIIDADCWNEIFNAVAPFHPSRKDHYSAKALQMGLKPPHFNENPSYGKTVDSKKLIEMLDYNFIHKSL
ncbi:SDR family oxidoreductase [Flavobacterium sp. 3HN19-14]|uniref:SDR family oxidoreductase n=1 Tax=Flavobacterium sp. 3HN19-14 TaxID=3448133 RepID=UPI003EE367CE